MSSKVEVKVIVDGVTVGKSVKRSEVRAEMLAAVGQAAMELMGSVLGDE